MKKLTILLVLIATAITSMADTSKGIAIAIVYDTSGSMGDKVQTATNQSKEKFRVANEALTNIVEKVDAYAQNHPVQASLITFNGSPIPLSKWNKQAFSTWLKKFDSVGGGTPLGEAIAEAGKVLAAANADQKHIVVLTDGESNGNLKPEAAVAKLKTLTPKPNIYIVAFDVNSAAFEKVKADTLILPANGKTLDTGLQTLFGSKILMEDEE